VLVEAKGKGKMQTYWVEPGSGNSTTIPSGLESSPADEWPEMKDMNLSVDDAHADGTIQSGLESSPGEEWPEKGAMNLSLDDANADANAD
jgi:hypothetical protein